MFEIEYNIDIQDNNEHYETKKTYENNLIRLIGKNDTGKTTILSLIKLALSGFKLENLNDIDSGDSIPNSTKLNFLLNKTKFDLSMKITDINNAFSIQISHTKSGESKYHLNKESSPYTALSDEVDVIYEIPTEPIKKLYHVLDQVSFNIRNYIDALTRYSRKVRDKYTELSEYETNEKRKDEVLKKLKYCNTQIKAQEHLLEQEILNKQETENRYTYNEYIQLKSEIEDLKNTIKHLNQQKIKASNLNKTINNSTNSFLSVMKDLKNQIYQNKMLFMKIEKYKKETEEFYEEKIFALDNPEIIDGDIIEQYDRYLHSLYDYAKDEINNIPIQQIEEDSFVGKLISLLEEYQDKNINIPGYNGSFNEFLGKLKEFYNKIKTNNIRYYDLKLIVEFSQSIFNFIETDFNKQFMKYSKLDIKSRNSNVGIYDINDIKQKIIENERMLSNRKDRLNIVEPKFKNLDKEYEYTELKTLRKDIQDIQSKIDKYNLQLENLKDEQNSLNTTLNNISDKKPKCNLSLDQLSNKYKLIEELNKELQSYNEVINCIKTQDISKINKDSQYFVSSLGHYLAELVNTIIHTGKTYLVDNIDFINKQYITKDGSKINFDQIGTGTTAVNGLISRIKQHDDKRLILLVDEIADMDTENFIRLTKAIEDEISSGHILLCVMAKPQ